MITNGMPMVKYFQIMNDAMDASKGILEVCWIEEGKVLEAGYINNTSTASPRTSWKNMSPDVLDMLTWCESP